MWEAAQLKSIMFDNIYKIIIKYTMHGNNVQESWSPSFCNCQQASWRGEGEKR